jgi:hypothetical protein
MANFRLAGLIAAIGLVMGPGQGLAATSAEPDVVICNSAQAETASDSAPQTRNPCEEWIWIEAGRTAPSGPAQIQVRYLPEYARGGSIEFDCMISSVRLYYNAMASLEILGEDRKPLYGGELTLDVRGGDTPCTFTWNGDDLPPGIYTAYFTLRRSTKRPITWQELVVRKLSPDTLAAQLLEAATSLQSVTDFLNNPDLSGLNVPYARVRAAFGEDAVALARRSIEKRDWRRADQLVRYIKETAESVRSQLVFGGPQNGSVEAGVEPNLSELETRGGGLYVRERPVLLLGATDGSFCPETLARSRRHGLNFAVAELGPRDTLASETGKTACRAGLNAYFEQATASNLAVVCRLAPQSMWPSAPEKRRDLENHFREAAASLRSQPMLAGLCVADRPKFRFDGDTVRQGFAGFVREVYLDRDELNRSWRMLLKSMDEAEILWDHARPAYQYDWQTYHTRLGTEFLGWMRELAAGLVPDTPLQVAVSDDVFEPGESRHGIDHEELAALFDISGCMARNHATDPVYAMGYPQQTMIYSLLRSFAPDKPVFNLENRVISEQEDFGACSYAYLHSLTWEGAMAGLNASALWTGTDSEDTLLTWPEYLEGYAAACFELNRLGNIVTAFQEAPADLAILWSVSSKIYEDGQTYLSSVRRAFEGSCFSGRKVRFVTEKQCSNGVPHTVKLLVIPETLTVSQGTFAALKRYVHEGGLVIRRGAPIPYDERGNSRQDMLNYTTQTVLVRGRGDSTEFLHAIDAVYSMGLLEPIPRAINAYGYPLEGVRTLYVEKAGEAYLYVLNLRKEPVRCHILGERQTGHDLIRDRSVSFPALLEPLDPMLIRLDKLPAPEITQASRKPPGKAIREQKAEKGQPGSRPSRRFPFKKAGDIDAQTSPPTAELHAVPQP